jgi:uncharacterized protein YecE (DUF72 family)
MIISILL